MLSGAINLYDRVNQDGERTSANEQQRIIQKKMLSVSRFKSFNVIDLSCGGGRICGCIIIFGFQFYDFGLCHSKCDPRMGGSCPGVCVVGYDEDILGNRFRLLCFLNILSHELFGKRI